MPLNTTVTVPKWAWVELTNADVTEITFVNEGGSPMAVKGTTGSAPTDLTGSITYRSGEGERLVAMADLFPGITGADRLWAYGIVDVTYSMVSHA
jgi:hypothetical protein